MAQPLSDTQEELLPNSPGLFSCSLHPEVLTHRWPELLSPGDEVFFQASQDRRESITQPCSQRSHPRSLWFPSHHCGKSHLPQTQAPLVPPQITSKAPAGHGVGTVVISDTPPFPRSAKEGFII